ncbi:hypothetical protein [Nonomuraea bangladeshensis]|uniref:hypothetical protein n=1 Tax=Nonomuraea bangladeshensis TaxID=404385 RepID=UPI0031DB499B
MEAPDLLVEDVPSTRTAMTPSMNASVAASAWSVMLCSCWLFSTLPYARVPDELYARASAHYDDRAMWSLVMAIAHLGFFTPAALIAKPIPGMPPGRNYSA